MCEVGSFHETLKSHGNNETTWQHLSFPSTKSFATMTVSTLVVRKPPQNHKPGCHLELWGTVVWMNDGRAKRRQRSTLGFRLAWDRGGSCLSSWWNKSIKIWKCGFHVSQDAEVEKKYVLYFIKYFKRRPLSILSLWLIWDKGLITWGQEVSCSYKGTNGRGIWFLEIGIIW
jgi:hypothetical protein